MKAQFFDSPAELREWFEAHHETADELWVGIYKKSSGEKGVTLGDALDQALCFGWIDSKGRRIDDARYTVRFTRRRKGSNWSQRNIARVKQLRDQGLMHEAGLRAFESRSE